MKPSARFFGSSPFFATLGRQFLTAIGGLLAIVVCMAVLGFVAEAFHLGDTLMPIGALPLMIAVLLGWVPSTIAVGDDGVLVRWIGWKRFVPWGDIDEVVAIGNGMQLKLKSGKTVLVASSFFRISQYSYQTEKRDQMLREVGERLDAHRAAPQVAEATALVGRAGRSIEAWLAAVRGLLSNEGGYRAPTLTRDVLWRVAEDPALEETARIGAAIALRSGASDADRERLRVVATSTVSPKVRVALDAAVALPDEELESKLRTLD